MVNQGEIKSITDYYNSNIKQFEGFEKMVCELIKNILEANSITYQSINSRIKKVESIIEKVKRKKYSNGINSVSDIIGIRIISYTISDVKKICDIIENEFLIDKENSENKHEILGPNKIGYLSIHYIAYLSNNRSILSEYRAYKDLRCEIQIRTVLQHAWAEIEHDRCYKLGQSLPFSIERGFNLISGVLELMDNEFERLSKEIDEYKINIKEQTELGNLELEINTITLTQYLDNRLNDERIEKTFLLQDNKIIYELKKFGIKTLKELQELLSEKFINNYCNILKSNNESTNYTGFLRGLMLITDYKNYFKNCWNNDWAGFSKSTLLLIKHYKIDYENFPDELIDNSYFVLKD